MVIIHLFNLNIKLLSFNQKLFLFKNFLGVQLCIYKYLVVSKNEFATVFQDLNIKNYHNFFNLKN